MPVTDADSAGGTPPSSEAFLNPAGMTSDTHPVHDESWLLRINQVLTAHEMSLYRQGIRDWTEGHNDTEAAQYWLSIQSRIGVVASRNVHEEKAAGPERLGGLTVSEIQQYNLEYAADPYMFEGLVRLFHRHADKITEFEESIDAFFQTRKVMEGIESDYEHFRDRPTLHGPLYVIASDAVGAFIRERHQASVTEMADIVGIGYGLADELRQAIAFGLGEEGKTSIAGIMYRIEGDLFFGEGESSIRNGRLQPISFSEKIQTRGAQSHDLYYESPQT